MNAGAGGIRTERFFKPGNLVGVKLVLCRVVEIDEIDSALDPVVVGLGLKVGGIILQALRAQNGQIELASELRKKRGVVFWCDRLVIPDPQIKRNCPERSDLILDEI